MAWFYHATFEAVRNIPGPHVQLMRITLFGLLILASIPCFGQPALKPLIGDRERPRATDSICAFAPITLEQSLLRGPLVGDTVPDLRLHDLNGQPFLLSDTLALGQPVLLVGVSYSCPFWREVAGSLDSLSRQYASKVRIFLVYTMESHPLGNTCFIEGRTEMPEKNRSEGIQLPQHATYGDRLQAARTMDEAMGIALPLLVDGPCNPWFNAFGPKALPAYLLRPDGSVAARHQRLNAKGMDIACDIDRLLGISSDRCRPSLAERPEGRRRQPGDRKVNPTQRQKQLQDQGRWHVPDQQPVYRTVGKKDLHLLVWEPKPRKKKETRPAILLLHGGGWQRGNPENMAALGKAFADSGLVALSLEYRLADSSTTLRDGVEDAFHALAWVGAHAGELGVDPKRIAILGASSGGHLAACLGSLDSLRKVISPNTRPSVLILASAATSLDSTLLASAELQLPRPEREALSPLVQAGKKHPPTLLLYSPMDGTVPPDQQYAYFNRLRRLGVPCNMEAFPGSKHNLFNEDRERERVVGLSLLFLRRHQGKG